jgi:putative acetyltransferase
MKLAQNIPVIEIVSARSASEIESVRHLFREYSELVSEALCFQGFDEELAALPGDYAEPAGVMLLAREVRTDAARAAGCVALRGIGDARAEMKRMYVREAYRGSGLGRRLAVAVIDHARRAGYRSMYLDTLPKLKEAIALYGSLGFRACGPYLSSPTPGAVCFELSLS